MPLKLSVHVEEWPTVIPFRITGRCRNSFKLVLVKLTDGTHWGRGEGLPIHYLGESVDTLCRQIEAAAGQIERGVDRKTLQDLMPAGGARNAVDSAMWDLEAKRTGKSIWSLTGIVPRSVTSIFTIGMEDTPEGMSRRAVEASMYPILKIKVDTDRPVERVAAVRAARPDAGLTVDANQGWSFEQLRDVAPRLAELGVQLIEQPLPRGKDEVLDGYTAPIPLCADESCQHRGELREASERYQIINIKLDKTGGLTEALLLAQEVRGSRLGVYVGNMGGTSLSMAPAFVVGQLGDYVELDGPLLLKQDRFPGLQCQNGKIAIPDPAVWG